MNHNIKNLNQLSKIELYIKFNYLYKIIDKKTHVIIIPLK